MLREVVAECVNPALLFSGGKDSICLLRVAQKAFHPDKLPFPLLHIDTGHNFPEVMQFRDQCIAESGEKLIVGTVEASIASGRVRLKTPQESRNAYQSITLLDTIAEYGFDALFGGARRDEEKARAKERMISHRDEWGQWDPKNQRPELWSLYNTRIMKDEHLRVFPLSNWTELDIWQYIAQENLSVPSIYFAHEREVVERHGLLVPITAVTPLRQDDNAMKLMVRFRTVGDMTCTCPVASNSATVEAIIAETLLSQISERGSTRLDDQTNDASMELRKKEGYF
jgi:sulfate adenylyltransferase subunit 2